MTQRKKINLALQGGGSHGAFTWGLLDKILESDLFIIEGVSATSAGSMNAAMLADGFIKGGNEGARQALHDFWYSISKYHRLFGSDIKSLIDSFMEPILNLGLGNNLLKSMGAQFSPYEFNPFNFHPIRDVLEELIDIEKIKKTNKIKLFICATNVRSGKIHIFNNKDLSIDAFLASACLPRLFKAVEINGEFYWDGGFLGNPAIFPLIYETKCEDIVVFHTVPIVRQQIPKSVDDIANRLKEVSFNSSLMREMRAIAFISNMVSNGWLKKEFESKLKKVFMHGINADSSLSDLALATVYCVDWDFLTKLRDLGREQATIWIEKNYDSIGKKTTIDFDEWL